ncbi:MAG: NAD-dependent epimerase/dehydratase family protein, partial [Verrucomicrobiae bacterium]|nr:NAD-dependent epimerase/dehydratase family protein [Verrucomicrobiae bacterium]
MRIAITGGAGFIGSNLSAAALRAGHEVVVLDDFSTGYRDNVVEGARLVEGTILDPLAVDDAFAGTDSVVHLAALGSVPRSIADPLASHAANATGTLSVLEGARRAGCSHVVAASSSSVYGMNPA